MSTHLRYNPPVRQQKGLTAPKPRGISRGEWPLRILLVSDLHQRQNCLTAFQEIIGHRKFDGVLCLGDLTERRSGNAKYALDFLALCRSAGLPVRMVHGNNDDSFIRKLLTQQGILWHFRCEKLWGERFCGIGWLDEAGAAQTPAHFDVAGAILLTHAPPTWKTHFASHSVPKLHLSGHMHSWEGEEVREGVRWVKVPTLMRGRYGILALPEQTVTFHSFS